MLDAMSAELHLQKDFAGKDDSVETIYFGGGTPSLLSGTEIHKLISDARSIFNLAEDTEITLEANPDDITEDSLIEWKHAGVNRLSIGIQSFRESDLQWMNRAHTASQAMDSLRLAVNHFSNITADVIYGIPGLADDEWELNVKKLVDSGIQHISCYALTVESHTPLAKMIRENKLQGTDQDHQARQFLLLISWLTAAGFEHYEISNFARPGYRSRHNSAYWSVGPTGQGKKYLGIGPSAHSYNGTGRQWNISNNQQYIRSIESGIVPFTVEELNGVQKKNEYIMTALRTYEGIELARLDAADRQRLALASKVHLERGHLVVSDEHIRLTTEGKLFADGIAADLFE